MIKISKVAEIFNPRHNFNVFVETAVNAQLMELGVWVRAALSIHCK